MQVACNKCKKFITKAAMYKSPDIAGRTILDVFCHGEKDTMHFDDPWIAENQDFMFLITNNLVRGIAFKDVDAEYEKFEVGDDQD